MTRTLSAAYGRAYDRLLAVVGADARIKPCETSLLWPMVGHRYDG